MATVSIHIGAPKTATSTLQAVLASKHKKLLARRTLYPKNCRHGDAHHVLVCDLIEKYHGNPMPDLWYGNYPRGEAWSALCSEIRAHEGAIDSVILSTELFFGQVNKIDLMLADVRESLAEHEIKVIVYLRRQDQLYSSFYNQDVKGARQWPHSAYQFYETHQIFHRSYYDMLQTWSEVFGVENVLVRPYEPAQWLDGSIVRDFCQTAGIDSLRGLVIDRNKSLGVTQLYVKRCLNRVGYDKGDNDQVRKLLVRLVPEKPATDILYVNRRLYNKYRQQWNKTNCRLAQEFLGRENLFYEAIPAAAELHEYKVDQEKITLFLQAVLRHFRRGKPAKFRSLFARAALLVMAEQNVWGVLDSRKRSVLLAWVN
jgi:hypothetical protein